MGNLVFKPATGAGNKVVFQDRNAADALTIEDTGAITVTGATTLTGGVTGDLTVNDGIKQQSSKAVTGTYTSTQMLLADTYSLTGDATINSNVVLGSLTGSDITLVSDSTSVNRTITGTGTLEIGEITAKAPSAPNIIAGGLTKDADISDALDAGLQAKGIKKNVVVGFNHNTHDLRTTVATSQDVSIWKNAVTINKRYPDTHLHWTGHITGHGRSSYPFYGTYVEQVGPDGTAKRRFVGSSYIHCGESSAQEVIWHINMVFNPAECGLMIGNFTINLGFHSANSSNNTIFTVWNPNASDDNRGSQQGSVARVMELYLDEGQGY